VQIVETINERIAWCVKDSNLTKTAFAEKINVSQSFISRLVSGEKVPSDRTIADICREFNISELWLRTGEGDPHIQRDEDEEFLEVMEQIHMSDDDLIKRIIKAYWFMEDDEKAAIRKLIDGFTKK
jgi:transcriptional regulator with XRE-family HTH domain